MSILHHAYCHAKNQMFLKQLRNNYVLCYKLQYTQKFLALYRVICLNITKTFNGFLGVYQTSIPLNYTFVRMTDFKNCYVIAGHSDTHL